MSADTTDLVGEVGVAGTPVRTDDGENAVGKDTDEVSAGGYEQTRVGIECDGELVNVARDRVEAVR